MTKEKLIAAMREAIMSSIWIDHVGDIAGVDSAAGMCAEAALTLMSRELQAKDTTIKELETELEMVKGLLKERFLDYLYGNTTTPSEDYEKRWKSYCIEHNITP